MGIVLEGFLQVGLCIVSIILPLPACVRMGGGKIVRGGLSPKARVIWRVGGILL